jgi:hypothetical protein
MTTCVCLDESFTKTTEDDQEQRICLFITKEEEGSMYQIIIHQIMIIYQIIIINQIIIISQIIIITNAFF